MARMVEKRILVPSRLRRLREGFGWIDRRFVRDGLIGRLEQAEILLYFFLVAVADRHGLSYWGDARTAALLRLSPHELVRARDGLVRRELVAYEAPLYQVLDLEAPARERTGAPVRLGELLRRLGTEREA